MPNTWPDLKKGEREMNQVIHELWVPSGLKNHPSRDMAAIKHITIHTTGNRNPTATAEAHARFQFTGGGGRQASWHYTVDTDEIWQSFRDEQMCWHTGTRTGNETSIGIEICVNSLEAFRAACERSALLTATLLKRHSLSISEVVQHHDWSGKNCPAELRSNTTGITWEDFLAMVDKYLSGGQNSTPKPLNPKCADVVIDSLRDAGVAFQPEHWRAVLIGDIRPNREWTKVLMGRIIDKRWHEFGPVDIGDGIKTLLGVRK